MPSTSDPHFSTRGATSTNPGWVRLGENCCLTTKGTKGTTCVFVPFVAIPGKDSAAEFCKPLLFPSFSGARHGTFSGLFQPLVTPLLAFVDNAQLFPVTPFAGSLPKKHSAVLAIDRAGRVEDELAAYSPAGQVQHALKVDSFIQPGLGQRRSNASSHRQVGADETGAAGPQNGGSRGNSGSGVQWISSIRSTARLAFRRISSGTSMTYRF